MILDSLNSVKVDLLDLVSLDYLSLSYDPLQTKAFESF